MLRTAQGICSINQIQTRVTHGHSPTLVVLLSFFDFQLISGLLAKWTDMNNFARVGIIVGIFIGISFIIFLVMSLCFFCFSRKKYKRLQD